MFKRILRIIITLIGVGLGIGIVKILDYFKFIDKYFSDKNVIYIYITGGFIVGIIFLLFSNKFIKGVKSTSDRVEKKFQSVPVSDMILGSVGLVTGFIIAFLASNILSKIPYVGVSLSLISYVLLGYLGIRIFTRKKDDLGGAFEKLNKQNKEKLEKKEDYKGNPKILDTSVIIDGRVYEICKVGFLEGPIIIPEFVLKELQYIADSSDDLTRSKGRRGLDVLNNIQKELDIEVIITDKDFEDTKEVDLKLIKLGQFMSAKIVTNDYNLNKVSEVHGVKVLNINELSNAIKPVAIPGEKININVIKEGKENNQGIAYLDDGTMIVVEDGKKLVGENIDMLVTSVIQTPAGRMIFGKSTKKKI